MQLAWSIKHDFQRGALFDRFPTGTLEKLRQRRAHSSFAYLTLVSQVPREPSYPADATAMAPGQRVRYHHVTLTPNEGDNGSSSSISIELPRANDAVCSIRTNVTGVTHLISSNKTLLPHTISLSFIEENCGS